MAGTAWRTKTPARICVGYLYATMAGQKRMNTVGRLSRGWRDAERFRLTELGLRFADAAAELFLRS